MGLSRNGKRIAQRIRHEVYRATLPFRSNGFSCFGEEKVLADLAEQIVPQYHLRTVVDIGAGDGRVGSNTHALFKQGCRGLVVERDRRKFNKLVAVCKRLDGVVPCCCDVTPGNVVALLQAYSVERSFCALSLDIDSYDYWVLDSILSGYRPSIVVTEINEKIPPPIRFKVKFAPGFQLRDHFFGYSISCLDDLCATHDYALIHLEYNNAFLVPRELAGERGVPAEAAYRRGYLERPDRLKRFPRNRNMEVLHTLEPQDGVVFIRNFFEGREAEYELSASPVMARNHEEQEISGPFADTAGLHPSVH